jgi:CheY-like chemotaxis protein
VKFTERGMVQLCVTVANDLAPSDATTSLCFEISDTGIGMTEQQIERLFTPFMQADGSTTRRFGGTGLGLTITRDLIALMGGTIEVESQLALGSRFRLRLPFGRPDTDLDGQDMGCLRERRILCIARNAAGLATLGHDLSRWGVRFEQTDDCTNALARLRSAQTRGRPFDAVVIDVQIPSTEDVPVAQAIRSLPEMAHLPLVVIGPMGPTTADAGHRDTARVVLSNPLRPGMLEDALCRLLSSRDSSTATARPARPRTAATAMRVLLAEDNLVNQQVAHRMLKKLGIEVDLAANGAEAIERLAQQGYDAVLMDMQMPILDGLEATRQWRERERCDGRAPTPIIAMTANAMESDREACLDAGMDDYLAKPITLASLGDTLKRWIALDEPVP